MSNYEDAGEALNANFCKELEILATRYHDAFQELEGITNDEAFITGVDFLFVFDIKALVGDKVRTAHYGMAGNQSQTTTLGMAVRASHFSEDLLESGLGED